MIVVGIVVHGSGVLIELSLPLLALGFILLDDLVLENGLVFGLLLLILYTFVRHFIEKEPSGRTGAICTSWCQICLLERDLLRLILPRILLHVRVS